MNYSTARRSRLWLIGGAVALVVLLASAGAVRAQDSTAYAILIVGDEGDAEMLRTEKILINEMAKHIRDESGAERLPVYSYHFNKERERAYCENKLNVLAEDLLFVGVVTLDNKVPLKVVYRIDRINNSPRAAKDVLERADELLGGGITQPVTVPVQPIAPASPPSPPPSTSAPADSGALEGYRVQLGSFTLRKYAEDRKAEADKAGFQTEIVETQGPDGDALYKVMSPLVAARAQGDEALSKLKAAGFDQAFLVRVSKK
jgi:hypothetical protein